MEINRDKVYEVNGYSFHNFVTLENDDIDNILQWRNHPEVRRWMYNSSEISVDSHHKFVKDLNNRDDCYYWLVKRKGVSIGCVNFVDIDRECNRGEIGLYLNPQYLISGLGFDFVYNMFNFIYNELDVNEILGSVAIGNRSALILDTYFGCKINGSKEIGHNKFITYIGTRKDFNHNIEDKLKLSNFVKYAKNFNYSHKI